MLHAFCPSFPSNTPSTSEMSTLSLHDALPISAADRGVHAHHRRDVHAAGVGGPRPHAGHGRRRQQDRKSTCLNSSHVAISYAVFCLKKKKNELPRTTGADITDINAFHPSFL